MKRKFPFTQKEFKSIYSRVPRLCVDLVIKTKDGILLTYREKNGYEGLWHLPGSTVYLNEELSSTAKRVAKEELGIEIEVDEKSIGKIEYLNEAETKGFGHSISIVFQCSPKSLEFTLDSDTSDVKFFKKTPTKIIHEQKIFLENSGLLSSNL